MVRRRPRVVLGEIGLKARIETYKQQAPSQPISVAKQHHESAERRDRNENDGPQNNEQVNGREIFIICHNPFPNGVRGRYATSCRRAAAAKTGTPTGYES
jgi:hypothetical protein